MVKRHSSIGRPSLAANRVATRRERHGRVWRAASSFCRCHVVVACIPADADKGKFPLKDEDASMAAAFDYLRKHDAFPEDNDDDSDEMVFGDDDNLDDYE